MVQLHVKNGSESLFLYKTVTTESVQDTLDNVCEIQNARLCVFRLCDQVDFLAQYGISLPANMQGLTDEQIVDLKLNDEYEDRCVPSGGYINRRDPMGQRNGRAPNDKMKDVLGKTVREAKDMISKELVNAPRGGACVTQVTCEQAMKLLAGAVAIVYPMGLPEYDPVQMCIADKEELEGTSAGQDILNKDVTSLYWANKEMQPSKTLADIVGKNEKTTVIVKLSKKGSGPPAREPVVDAQTQREMMAHWHRKQEEQNKLAIADESDFSNAPWTDNTALKRELLGTQGLSWKHR
eukprot:Clim_evm59s152 gene=Clim_evmTU59s152